MTYWLTLAISAEDLARELGCLVEEIQDQDYIGGIRLHGECIKVEEIEDS